MDVNRMNNNMNNNVQSIPTPVVEPTVASVNPIPEVNIPDNNINVGNVIPNFVDGIPNQNVGNIPSYNQEPVNNFDVNNLTNEFEINISEPHIAGDYFHIYYLRGNSQVTTSEKESVTITGNTHTQHTLIETPKNGVVYVFKNGIILDTISLKIKKDRSHYSLYP